MSWVCFDRAFLYLYGSSNSGRDLTLTRTYSVLSTNFDKKSSKSTARRRRMRRRFYVRASRLSMARAARTVY